MDPRLEETIYLDFVTSSSTGAAADADSLPTAEVFEDATDTTVVALTVTKRTSKTGNYRVPVACTAANGFELGKSYNVVASATVGTVAAKAVVGRFVVRPAAAVANVTQIGGNQCTSAGSAATLFVTSINATNAAGAAVTVLGSTVGMSVTGTADYGMVVSSGATAGIYVGSPTIGINVQGGTYGISASGSTFAYGGTLQTVNTTTTNTDMRGTNNAALAATALSTADWTPTRAGYLDNVSAGAVALQSTVLLIAGYTDTEIAAIKLVTDHLATMLVLDGSVYQYTANALELGPAGSSSGGDDELNETFEEYNEVISP